jgi:hypothetical protein
MKKDDEVKVPQEKRSTDFELAEPDLCIMPMGPVGHVDEVNGPGACLVRGFVPTKYEVLELAKHWAEILIDLKYFCWCYETYGSDWSRRMAFAGMRLKRMEKCVGEEEIRNVYDAAFEKFGKSCDHTLWAKYVNGEQAPPITEEDYQKGGWGWVEEGLENLLRELLHLSSMREADEQALLVLRPLRKDLLELLERMKQIGDLECFWRSFTLKELISNASPGPGDRDLRQLLAEAMPPKPGGLLDLLHNEIRKALEEKSV